MPFKTRVFQENVEHLLEGSIRDDLARACEAYASLTTPQQKARSIGAMMEALDREVNEDTRRAIMEACGRRCIGASTLKRARRLQQEAQDLDDLLSLLNAAHIGGGHLQRDGDVIHATYDRCYCGSVSRTSEPLSATYCACSCGWYRQLFETLLEQRVEVDLLASIVQGDERCLFLIRCSVPLESN
jgi:predicted ArsR family transcriptional regulator